MTLGVFAEIERLVEYIPIHNDTPNCCTCTDTRYNINYLHGLHFSA